MGWTIAALTLLCPLMAVLVKSDFVYSATTVNGPKLQSFLEWKSGTRALITGNIVFSDDTSKPLDLIVTTIEQNIPKDMYCNQVVLGNAFFGDDQVKESVKTEWLLPKLVPLLDNTDVTTWLYLETQ